jgi:hypothetical protein
LFGNGLTDIVLSAQDANGNPTTQILVQRPDGKFVSAYQNIVTNFNQQAKALQAAKANSVNMDATNAVNIIQGPDKTWYFITTVSFWDNSTGKNLVREGVYLAPIGTANSNLISASQLLSNIQTQWPWMTAAQANQVMAQTSTNYLDMGQVLNPVAAMQPVGALSVNRNNPQQKITGFISGVKNIPELSQIQAFDSTGRNFTINLTATNMTSAKTAWDCNNRLDQLDGSSQAQSLVGSVSYIMDPELGLKVGGDNQNFTLGFPQYKLSDDVTIDSRFTKLSFNPWLSMDGSWGKIIGSNITEFTGTYRIGNYRAQVGFMNTSTELQSGLVTKIGDMQAVWTEAGYAESNWGVFAGVKPYMLNSNISAKLPTSVDQQGNAVYTNVKLQLNNQVDGYVRAVYDGKVNKYTDYKLATMYAERGNYEFMATLKLAF